MEYISRRMKSFDFNLLLFNFKSRRLNYTINMEKEYIIIYNESIKLKINKDR